MLQSDECKNNECTGYAGKQESSDQENDNLYYEMMTDNLYGRLLRAKDYAFDLQKELDSKDKYIEKLEGVVKQAEEMFDALLNNEDVVTKVFQDYPEACRLESVEGGIEESKLNLIKYLKERYDYKHGNECNMGCGLYDYLNSMIK